MIQENKTIKEYIDSRQLEIGGYVYSYILGTLFEYRLMCIEDNFAMLRPTRMRYYEKPRKWDRFPYTDERDIVRAEISIDTRFNVNENDCLQDAIESLQKHINSSTWQKEKAEKLLKG